MLSKKQNKAQKAQDKRKTLVLDGKEIQLKFMIYVLKLEGGFIYVGKTTQENYQARLKLHKQRQACAWTRKHKFVEEMKNFYLRNASPFDEDRRVKQMMYLVGPNKVRGGTYSKTTDLSPQQVEFIMKQFRGAADQCLFCSKNGHFIKQCKQYQQYKNSQKYKTAFNKKRKKHSLQKNIPHKRKTNRNYQQQSDDSLSSYVDTSNFQQQDQSNHFQEDDEIENQDSEQQQNDEFENQSSQQDGSEQIQDQDSNSNDYSQ